MAELSEAAKQARRDYHRQWRHDHPDAVREYNRRYRKTHKDNVRAANDRYWENRAAK